MPIPRVDPTAESAARRIVSRLAFTPVGQWTLRHISPRVDPPLARLTRGRVSTLMITPLLLLTHKGAKSGVERTTPLIYFTDGDRVIPIASNYGGTRHPSWYYNVKANPAVTLSAGGFEGRFVGEEVTGVERDRLWNLAKSWVAGYTQYERTAGDRQIPMLAFTPVASAATG